MAKRVRPYITPTVELVGRKEGEIYHYNAADNQEMLRRWNEYPQGDIVNKVPIQLDIETTTICNLECPMCFQAYDETKPTPINMTRDLYNHIIDEFSEKGGMSIKMMYRGEPLVTRDLHEWVGYASDRGIQTCFNTNGVLLTEERSRELIDAGLHQLIFSIDSHIAEEYEQIRRPNANSLGNFQRTLSHVQGLARLRDEMGSKYPIIEVSRVDLPKTKDSKPDFRDFWLKNGADFVSFVGLNDYSMGKGGNMLVSDDFCCEMPWQRMFILADGLVTQCCGDLYQKFPLAQMALPSKIEEYNEKLEELVTSEKSPGDRVELEILSAKNLEKVVIGEIQEDGSIKATKMKVKGISGNTNVVPITSSVEEAWTGKLSSHMREMNRRGCAHKINACADCGYRETTIVKSGMPSRMEPRKKHVKTGQIKYLDE